MCCSTAAACSTRFGELAALARPEGPWVVIDAYHSFMAIPAPIGAEDRRVGVRPRRRL